MELPRELEGYIKEYIDKIKDTNYFKKIISAGSKDVIGNIKKYLGKSLTIKILPLSMDIDEAPNFFLNIENMVKESQKILEDTYTRNILNDKDMIFAFKIKTTPEIDILKYYINDFGDGSIISIGNSNKFIYILNSKIKRIGSDTDKSYILLLYLISRILNYMKNAKDQGKGSKFQIELVDFILKSFTISAYVGSSSTNLYEIEISDIHWIYKKYFENDKDVFYFFDKVLDFFKDANKDIILISILNKMIYIFLYYKEIDKDLLDSLYNELFKRAYERNINYIPDPNLIIMDQELENIYKKGFAIGKLFSNEEDKEYIEKVVLALKSERDINSFREKLINYIITGKTTDKNITLPSEFFTKELSKKDFIALKNSFLAGLWNGSHSHNDESSTD